MIADGLPPIASLLRRTQSRDDGGGLDAVAPMLPRLSTAFAAQRLIAMALNHHIANLLTACLSLLLSKLSSLYFSAQAN